MTLIIGAKCTNGIVIGSDSAATLSTAGGQTTATQVTKKLKIIDNKLIVGVSGPIGLGQRIIYRIENLWNGNNFNHKDPIQSCEIIRRAILEPIKVEYDAAVNLNRMGQNPLMSAHTHSIVAGVFKRELALIQFFEKGDPELASEDMPFVCIGSGQLNADPFITFLRRIFWESSAINVSDGIFAVLWTIQHSISVSPGGITEPIQIKVLKQVNDKIIVEELTEHQIDEAKESIQIAEDSLKNFKTNLTEENSTTEDPPKPP